MAAGRVVREVTVTRVEWVVPSGSDIKDVDLVQEWAWQDYCRRAGHDPKGSRYDNWCEVHARDEEIVFAFTVERSVPTADPPGWEGVSRAGAIRQAEDKRQEMQRWHDLFEGVKAERDERQSRLDRLNDLLNLTPDFAHPTSGLGWIADVRAALEGRT